MNYFYKKYKEYRKRKELEALRRDKIRLIYTKNVLNAYREASTFKERT